MYLDRLRQPRTVPWSGYKRRGIEGVACEGRTMINIRYERMTARELRAGDLFATAENPGNRLLRDQPVVNIGPPSGALGFGVFHVRTDESIRDEEDANATVYRITIET